MKCSNGTISMPIERLPGAFSWTSEGFRNFAHTRDLDLPMRFSFRFGSAGHRPARLRDTNARRNLNLMHLNEIPQYG